LIRTKVSLKINPLTNLYHKPGTWRLGALSVEKVISKLLISTVLFWVAALIPAEAQPRGRPATLSFSNGGLNKEEGDLVIERFRRLRWNGDFSFKFELRNIPRRGQGSVFLGDLWGKTNEAGPLHRVIISSTDHEDPKIIDLISQNGLEPHIWVFSGNTNIPVRELDENDMFSPLFEGLQYSPFDLQMPFIYWDNYVYEGANRTKGRKAYRFLFYPPESFAKINPELGAVRVYLDAKFNALLKAEILDPDGRSIRAYKIISLKKVQDQMIPRVIDIVDVRTRNKTRFTVVAAAMNLQLPHSNFRPQEFGKEPVEIPLDQFEFLE